MPSDQQEPRPKLYGYFSASHCRLYGGCYYLNPQGLQVLVSMISPSPERPAPERWGWTDTQPVGEVLTPVRHVHGQRTAAEDERNAEFRRWDGW